MWSEVFGACTGNPLIYLTGIESLNQFIHLIEDDVLQCSIWKKIDICSGNWMILLSERRLLHISSQKI